jgi:hypothetical protein
MPQRRGLIEPGVPTAMTESQKTVGVALVAASVHGLIAWFTNSHRIFFGAFGPYCVTGMLEIFFDYATQALNGSVPYRDYLIEYPILGFVLCLIPRLVVSDLAGYRVAFGVMLLLFNTMAVILVAQRVARLEGFDRVQMRLVWYTAFFASLCPLLMGPYDLAPMAVAFAGAYFWFSGRNATGGVLTGLGVLLKIFPGVVAAPALVWEIAHWRETRARGMLAFLGTVTAGVALWIVLGGVRFLDSLRYHSERGLLLESLYAGILMLIGKATGNPVTWSYHHKALHITPEWGDALARLSLPIQIAALFLVMWQYYRSGMKDGIRYAGAAVVAFMVFGKVLSPQFLIWLIPFVTVLQGKTGQRARWVFLLACVATTLIYPLIGLRLILERNSLEAIILLNYRNALLVGLYLLLVFGREPETAVAAGADSGTARAGDAGPGAHAHV